MAQIPISQIFHLNFSRKEEKEKKMIFLSTSFRKNKYGSVISNQ
jgi:hypothetical protein